jgi:predicted RNA-binding protein Jag
VEMAEWREIQKEFPHYLFKVEDSKFMYAPCKLTGRFDFHNLALHKNKSKLIIPKAIYHYFIHDILPKDYLESNKNIFDYCIGSKSKGDWKQMSRCIKNGVYEEKEIQKINRYYICKTEHPEACKITKVNKKDNREIQLEAGQWMQVLFNKVDIKPKWDLYKINQNYYFQLIESEIENIINYSPQQLKLF